MILQEEIVGGPQIERIMQKKDTQGSLLILGIKKDYKLKM